MDYLELTKRLLSHAHYEVGPVDPLSQYITYQNGKNTTYCIPLNVYLDFNFTELRKTFCSFIVEYRSSKRYYIVNCTLL